MGHSSCGATYAANFDMAKKISTSQIEQCKMRLRNESTHGGGGEVKGEELEEGIVMPGREEMEKK